MELRKVLVSSTSILTAPSISANRKSSWRLRPGPQVHRSVSSATGFNGRKEIPDHHSWPSAPDPTPYMILGVQPGESYSKSRYYDLVKIYHPDCYRTVASSLPDEIRTQRYRLVVAAHELLADPAKRYAYDSYGLGWIHPRRPTIRRRAYGSWQHYTEGSEGSDAPAAPFSWKGDLQHRRLALLVIVIAFFMQCCSFVVQNYKIDIQTRRLDDQCRRLLQSRRRRANDLGLLDAQTESFLLKRDPTGTGVTKAEEAAYRSVLPYCSYGG